MSQSKRSGTNTRTTLSGVEGRSAVGALTVTIHGPLPADNPFYAYVGRVASEWSQIEHILDVTIWSMLGIHPVEGACITSQIMGVGPRCKVIGTLGKVRGVPDSILKAVRTLMSQSYDVADTRARFVHDPWYLEVNSLQPAQFRAMPYKNPKYGFTPISEADVEHALGEIKKLQDEAKSIKGAILEALRTST